MVFSFLSELVISILVLVVVLGLYIKSKNPLLPKEWPLVGILPSLLDNLNRLHDYITFDILAMSGHSLKLSIGSKRIFVTSDPANVRHIFTSNKENYTKGEEFTEIFDVTMGSLITIDGESCGRERANYQSLMSSPRLVALMIKCCRDKVEMGLVPFMTHMMRTNNPVDINDLMKRLVFDLYATSIFGVDPARLSIEMPPMHVANAMDTVMEVAFVRHVVPALFWRVMRRLNIGPERKLTSAQAVLRYFTTDMIMERRKNGHVIGQEATLVTYMITGRDIIGTTLPWIVYNLAKNPHVVSSIRDELAPIIPRKEAIVGASTTIFELDEVKGLTYLHATLLETLRLYPPIPIEFKFAATTDVMPSAQEVCAQDMVLVSIYSMGRMDAIWGADCQEFKPERWLSEDRRQLRHVPSHKFLAFNSGPRLCHGKDISIIQMKIIVAAIVWNFDLETLDCQSIDVKLSCLLQMKNRLKLKLNKREI